MNLTTKSYPIGHLLNPQTPYTNAASTDIRETFKRIAAQQQQAKPQKVKRVK